MNLESHPGHATTTKSYNSEPSLYQKSTLPCSSTKIETDNQLLIPHTEEELREQISAQLFQFNPFHDKTDPKKQFQQLSQEFVMHEMITEDERRKFYNEHVQDIADDNLEVIDPSLPCDMCSFIYEHAFQLIGHSKRVLDHGLNEILQLNSHKLMVHEMHQVLLKPSNGKVDSTNGLNRYIVSNIGKWLLELHQRYQQTKQQILLDKNCNQRIITDNWLVEQRQMYLYAVEMQNKNFEEQKQMYIGNSTKLVTGNELTKSTNMGDTHQTDSLHEIFVPSKSVRCTDNNDGLCSKTNLSSEQDKHCMSATIPNKIALQVESSQDKLVNNTYQQLTPSCHGVANSESQYRSNGSLLPTNSYQQQLASTSHPLHTDSLSNVPVSNMPITNLNTIITSSNPSLTYSSGQHGFNTPPSCSQLQMYPNECSQIPAVSNVNTNHQFIPRYSTTTTMSASEVQSSFCKYNSNYITPDLIYGQPHGHTTPSSLTYSLPFYHGMMEIGDTPSTTIDPGIAGYINSITSNQFYNLHPGFTVATQPASLPNFTDSMREIGKKIKTLQDLNIKHPKTPIYSDNHFAERVYNETASIPQYNVKQRTSTRSPSLMYNTHMSYNEHYQNQLRIYDEYNYLQNRLHNASPLLFPKTHGGKLQKRSNNIRNSPWNY